MSKKEKEEDVEKGRNTKMNIGMSNLPKLLTLEEKKYLLAVERCDMANVKRMLHRAQRTKSLDINCVDSLGRGALTISIDQENLELVELLVIMGVETKDALLHAINVDFVEAVEFLLEHEELIHKEGDLYSWQKVDKNTASFTPDITPLILAAHRNNYEILKILLDRGATLPMPHDIKCGCEECIALSQQDSLRQALSRLNEYKALASPSLIALSSSDPILTAFQLSWELRGLAFAEPECKSEYLDLRRQCQQFAVNLLHQSRSSQELAIILNHDPENPKPYEEGEHMQLARLELAIQYKQKKFVAHPNIQQLLAAIWYEGVPGFRRKSPTQKIAIIVKVALLFPFYCMLYLVAPNTHTGKLMRKPFMKFLIHASSYLFFLLILILVSQRVEDLVIELFGSESWRESVIQKYEKQRGNPPMILEYVVFLYVLGFIVEETHEMYLAGVADYLRNMWNIIDFTRNFLYTAVIVLRVAAYFEQKAEISRNSATAYLRREEWAPFDFQLVAEGLFAAANIFSALKLVHLFSINPHLGPLQISLGRMVIDIVKFFFIYSLVLFAFACGLNQLLWYFSDLERQKCFHLPNGNPDFDNFSDSCMKWRRFANVFESSQSLFWASFGLVDLSSFELTGIKTYTRFWGLLMFGSYSVINVIVLLNLLIAMMSNSYAIIDEHSDTEWKFARTKLWMSYFEETATLPPPFNIIPTPKMLLKFLGLRKKDKLSRLSTKRRNREEKERDYKYSAVMRALVWRYVSAMHKKVEENPVTEDDVNELKSDISSFRYEIMDVLYRNGMKVSSSEREEKAILGKKNKIWERRLLKDFKVGPIATEDDEDILYAPPPSNETATARFRRIAKMAILNSGMNKWRQVVKGVCIASQIGHCHSRDSFAKQQNLQKAMTEVKRLSTKSPSISRPFTPIHLPDISGSNIMNIIADIKGEAKSPSSTSNNSANSDPLPSTSRKKADLINLGNHKRSHVEDAISTSYNFKYILGDEFVTSGPSTPIHKLVQSKNDTKNEKNYEMINDCNASDNKITAQNSEDSDLDIIKTYKDVVKDDSKFEIKDISEDLSFIHSSEMLHLAKPEGFQKSGEQFVSPKLKLTKTDGESIPLTSPYLSRKMYPSTLQSSKENLSENLNKSPETYGSCKSRQSGTEIPSLLPPSNSATKLEPQAFIQTSSIEKKQEDNLSKNVVGKTSPPTTPKNIRQEVVKLNTVEDEVENSFSSMSQLDTISSILPDDKTVQKNSNASAEKKIETSSSSSNSKVSLQEIKTEEYVLSKPEKPKGQSVTFSLLDDKNEEAGDLVKPISPEKSTKSIEFQSKSTKQVTTSSTLSPNVSRSQNPPGTIDQKSPLASRNIHRVKKKYQPKHGWL